MEKIFLKLLTEERKKQGLTRKELALKVGCTYEAIKYWETGKRTPSIVMADKVLRALGITLTLGEIVK